MHLRDLFASSHAWWHFQRREQLRHSICTTATSGDPGFGQLLGLIPWAGRRKSLLSWCCEARATRAAPRRENAAAEDSGRGQPQLLCEGLTAAPAARRARSLPLPLPRNMDTAPTRCSRAEPGSQETWEGLGIPGPGPRASVWVNKAETTAVAALSSSKPLPRTCIGDGSVPRSKEGQPVTGWGLRGHRYSPGSPPQSPAPGSPRLSRSCSPAISTPGLFPPLPPPTVWGRVVGAHGCWSRVEGGSGNQLAAHLAAFALLSYYPRASSAGSALPSTARRKSG